MLLQLLFSSLLLSCFVMTLVWLRQYYTRNAGIVDGWWSYLFGFIVILYALMAPGDPVRKMIITWMVVVWSARLGTHLLIRNTQHTTEDIRYRKLREEYDKREHLYMWRFFMYQALSNVLLSIPFLVICLDSASRISPLVLVGVGVWLVALTGETLSDQQLKTFKSNPENRDKVCRKGLWNYSRHPNYFFEWLIWVSYALVALGSPYGAWGLLSPVIIFILLNYVTGIPMLEALALKSKGEAYAHYQKTTSAFFPWLKRNA